MHNFVPFSSRLCLLLATASVCIAKAVENRSSLACLPRFRTEPQYFEPCKTNICFLVKTDIPCVNLDPRMVAENNQTLFRCRDRAAYFPELSGISFDVKDALAPLEDAHCIYAGNQCTSDQLMSFVAKQSESKEKYRFAVSGISFLLPSRITRFTRPSVPILGGKMVIVGPRAEPPRRKDVFRTMLLPFDRNALLCVTILLAAFLVLWFLTVLASSRPLNFRNFVRHAVCELDTPSLPATARKRSRRRLRALHYDIRLSNILSTRALSSAFKVFLAIFIIFYELVAFYWIFEERAKTSTIDVRALTSSKLSEYIVPSGGALEFVFRKTVDPNGKFVNGTVPYFRCHDFHKCFSTVLNKTAHSAKFLVTVDLGTKFFLDRYGACNRLAIYKTKKPFFSFGGVWYFSSNVPQDLRDRVDQAILTLRSENRMNDILTKVVDESFPLDCGKQSQRIDGALLGPLISVLLCPFFIVVIASLIWSCVNHIRMRSG